MKEPRPPLFLARRSYRQRRLADAARLLPVLGALLFFLPTLWSGATTTAQGVIYLFAVWAALILGAALLARRLDGGPGDRRPEDDAGGGGTGGGTGDERKPGAAD